MESDKFIYKTLSDYLNYVNNDDIKKSKFVVNKSKNKFQLFINNILVSETGFNIIQPDKWFDEKYVILFDLKTFEKFQGKGYAKFLLKKVFNYIRNELKLNIISLIVYKDNYKAVNLYFNCWFQIFCEYDDSYSLIKKLH